MASHWFVKSVTVFHESFHDASGKVSRWGVTFGGKGWRAWGVLFSPLGDFWIFIVTLSRGGYLVVEERVRV